MTNQTTPCKIPGHTGSLRTYVESLQEDDDLEDILSIIDKCHVSCTLDDMENVMKTICTKGFTKSFKTFVRSQKDASKFLMEFYTFRMVIEGDWFGLFQALCNEALCNEVPSIDCADETTGITPLMFACALYRNQFVKELLERGANVNAKDTTGKSAYDYIVHLGDDELITLAGFLLHDETHVAPANQKVSDDSTQLATLISKVEDQHKQPTSVNATQSDRSAQIASVERQIEVITRVRNELRGASSTTTSQMNSLNEMLVGLCLKLASI